MSNGEVAHRTAPADAPPAESRCRFSTLGGRLCLDFVNTLDWRGSVTRRREGLDSYAALVAWGQQMGLVDQRAARRLQEIAHAHPGAAGGVLERGHALREAIAGVLAATWHEEAPAADELGRLNAEVATALDHLRLAPDTYATSATSATCASGGTVWRWRWFDAEEALDQLLWLVARDAAELLTSGLLPRVRRCGSAECGWYFLDTSRNGTRHWCDMQTCGNRAKARRHSQRRRETG